MTIKNLGPTEIETKSFEIITSELGDKKIEQKYQHIIKRCIHTSADFEYADSLYFSPNAVETIADAFQKGAYIVTDTQMAKAGINKKALDKFDIKVHCFISDEDVAMKAQEIGTTRAAIAVEKAMQLDKPIIFAVGNAPTALIKLYELITEKNYKPVAIIAVPVGFVNVVESKELIMKTDIPCIVAKGRKGGSNIAATICNAILYSLK